MLQTTSIHYPSSFLPSHISLIVVPFFFFFLPHTPIPTLTFTLVSAVLEALPHVHFFPVPNRPAPNPFRYYGLLLLCLLLTFPSQRLPLLAQLYWKHSPTCISFPSQIGQQHIPQPDPISAQAPHILHTHETHSSQIATPKITNSLTHSVAIPLIPLSTSRTSFHSLFRSSESTIPHWLPLQACDASTNKFT